jgi:hypothetical protein
MRSKVTRPPLSKIAQYFLLKKKKSGANGVSLGQGGSKTGGTNKRDISKQNKFLSYKKKQI